MRTSLFASPLTALLGRRRMCTNTERNACALPDVGSLAKRTSAICGLFGGRNLAFCGAGDLEYWVTRQVAQPRWPEAVQAPKEVFVCGARRLHRSSQSPPSRSRRHRPLPTRTSDRATATRGRRTLALGATRPARLRTGPSATSSQDLTGDGRGSSPDHESRPAAPRTPRSTQAPTARSALRTRSRRAAAAVLSVRSRRQRQTLPQTSASLPPATNCGPHSTQSHAS
jgi:hypothetical protein